MRRDAYIQIRMTDEEKNALMNAAYMSGETMSNYVRRIVMAVVRKGEEKDD